MGKVKEFLKEKYVAQTRYHIIISILSAIVIVFLFVFVWNYISAKLDNQAAIPTCNDGSFYDTCSLNKPYYCSSEAGLLIEKASICGCFEGMSKSEESCIARYQAGPKEISLKYVLRGEERYLNITVYKGLSDYISGLPKSINYQNGEKALRSDFAIRSVNNQEQKQFLLPLLIAIQDITESKDDQVRIATSLVQNIEFGESNTTLNLPGGNEIVHSRYPYEVLYDKMGVCGEKSELLAFLLKEMGYGTVLFYYPEENHEALGIKCPAKYSLDRTGYCFIETTGSSIMTDTEIEYVGGIKLTSDPEIILISKGEGLGMDMYEYDDAKEMMDLRDDGFVLFRASKLKSLKEKYGLKEMYYIG